MNYTVTSLVETLDIDIRSEFFFDLMTTERELG